MLNNDFADDNGGFENKNIGSFLYTNYLVTLFLR